MKKIQVKTIKTVSIILGIIMGILLIGFLSWKYIAPFGKKIKTTITKIPGAKEATNLISQENSGFKLPSQIINTQIVRFPVDIKSKDIENIHAVLKFKSGPKEIKLGVRGDEKDKYQYKSFYQILVQNAATWNKVIGTSNILFQKYKKYNSIFDLTDNPPEKEKIGGYLVNMDTLSQNQPEKNETKNTVINTFLRGSHTFYIRVDQAPLILKVSKQDLNIYNGTDEIKISVYKEDKLLAEKNISDDGIDTAASIKKDPQSEIIELQNINPGIYKIDINCLGRGGDSLITKIETNQSKIIAKTLFILDNKPSTVYTNSIIINPKIIHISYAQTLKINDTFDLKLTDPDQNTTTDLEKLTNLKYDSKKIFKIYSPKNDIAYSGGGYFAFSPEQLFDPEIIHFTDLNTIDNPDNVDYVLTTLPPAKQEGDWLVSEVNFDPKDINVTGDKLYFSLEMPDLAKYSGELEIDSFEVEVNTKGVLSDKFAKKVTPTLTLIPTISPTPTVTPKTTSNPATAGPTPTTSINKNIKIKILNGGAPAGSAARYTQILKDAGYINTEAGNSDKEDLKNCTILYPNKYENEISNIEKLFKNEYKFINKAINAQDDLVTISIGATTK